MHIIWIDKWWQNNQKQVGGIEIGKNRTSLWIAAFYDRVL